MAKKKTEITTKLVVLEIRDYLLKRKGLKPNIVAMINADITVFKDGKLERFAVQLPLDDNKELSRHIKELVAQAIVLKYPNIND